MATENLWGETMYTDKVMDHFSNPRNVGGVKNPRAFFKAFSSYGFISNTSISLFIFASKSLILWKSIKK